MAQHGRVAMVAGATGLVGREILAALLADKTYKKVVAVGRRALSQQHPRLVQQVVDFSHLTKLPRADDVFIALGTTIKVAGSQAAFRAVDLDAVVVLARAARAAGATRLGVVSAMGASANSKVFYNRVKGEMEDALAALGFESLLIAQPSLLAGQRESLDQPTRPGERIGLALTRVLKPLIPPNYRPIAAKDVALALTRSLTTASPGTHRLLSGQMQGAADRSQGSAA